MLATIRKALGLQSEEERLTRQLLDSSRNRTYAHDIFQSANDDLWLWINTEGVRRIPELKELIPGLPPDEFQLATASSTGDETLRRAFDAYRLYRDLVAQHHGPLAKQPDMLDFGCGWGRVLRFFMRDVRPSRLWGIEMWDQQVAWAERTNPWCNFLHVKPEPPTPFTRGSFDVIMSYSVFSHLAHGAHLDWLREFSRLLRPGGIVIASTWGRDHAERLERTKTGVAKGVWDDHYAKAIRETFDRERWLREYDAGCFCHVDLGYPGYETYGETAIPERYVRDVWGARFAILDYISDRGRCVQDVIVARVKDPASRAV